MTKLEKNLFTTDNPLTERKEPILLLLFFPTHDYLRFSFFTSRSRCPLKKTADDLSPRNILIYRFLNLFSYYLGDSYFFSVLAYLFYTPFGGCWFRPSISTDWMENERDLIKRCWIPFNLLLQWTFWMVTLLSENLSFRNGTLQAL